MRVGLRHRPDPFACWTAADDLEELLGGQFVVDFVPEYSRVGDGSDAGHLYHIIPDAPDDMLFVDDRLGPLPSVCAQEFRRVARWYERVADQLEQIRVK
jgi:hypothetical protein